MPAAGESIPANLKSSTLRAFSALVLELNDPTLPEERLFDRLIEGVSHLVPHNSLWVACSDLQAGHITSYLGPWAQQAVDLAPAFCQHVQDHPQFMALCTGGSSKVDAVSDYVSRRVWRSTGMYDEVVSKVVAEDQMSASRDLNEQLTFSLVVNRDGWGFTDQERSVLALLVPHAIQAWRTRWLIRRAEMQLGAAFNASLPELCFQAMVDSFGNVVEAPEGALNWLHAIFHESNSSILFRQTLPDSLRSWLNMTLAKWYGNTATMAETDLSARLVTPDGTVLHARLAPGPRYGLHAMVVERAIDPVKVAVVRLQSLNLSERQAEVLYWLAEGKTNDEIAGILQISLFTVKAHLRAIFGIMMVENRHAAATVAWQLLKAPRVPWQT